MGKRTKGKKSVASSAYTAFLRLAGDSRWVSKRAYSLWLTNANWRNHVICRLQDDGLITCFNLAKRVQEKRRLSRKEKGSTDEAAKKFRESIPPQVHGLRYALTKKGREFLREYNPIRYSDGEDLSLTAAEYDERKIYRLSLLSETRAMAELAGYSVHPDAKPDTAALSKFPLEAADRPACTAWKAKPEDVERFRGYENSIFNQTFYRYYDPLLVGRHTGREAKDTLLYSCRETPVGCVYLLSELQKLAKTEAEYLGISSEEADKTRYARASGVFFSGNGPYLIYNTERTAIRLRKNGEDALRIYVNAWAGTVYRRSLTEVRDDGYGNQVEEPLEPKIRGTLLFGDETHRAAVNVILHTIESEIGFGKNRNEQIATQNYNLRLVPDTFFLPVIQEAIPLYALMVFPHWPMYLKDLALNYWEKQCPVHGWPKVTREFIGERELTGVLEDGSYLLTLIGLHLDTVRWMIGNLPVSKDSYTLVCMEWQKVFFDEILEQINPADRSRVKIHYLPQSELEGYVKRLYESQGLPYRTER